MCFGNTIIYRCCGEQEYRFFEESRCGEVEPFPAWHLIRGRKIRKQMCDSCDIAQQQEHNRENRQRLQYQAQAKALLEYFRHERPSPFADIELDSAGNATLDPHDENHPDRIRLLQLANDVDAEPIVFEEMMRLYRFTPELEPEQTSAPENLTFAHSAETNGHDVESTRTNVLVATYGLEVASSMPEPMTFSQFTAVNPHNAEVQGLAGEEGLAHDNEQYGSYIGSLGSRGWTETATSRNWTNMYWSQLADERDNFNFEPSPNAEGLTLSLRAWIILREPEYEAEFQGASNEADLIQVSNMWHEITYRYAEYLAQEGTPEDVRAFQILRDELALNHRLELSGLQRVDRDDEEDDNNSEYSIADEEMDGIEEDEEDYREPESPAVTFYEWTMRSYAARDPQISTLLTGPALDADLDDYENWYMRVYCTDLQIVEFRERRVMIQNREPHFQPERETLVSFSTWYSMEMQRLGASPTPSALQNSISTYQDYLCEGLVGTSLTMNTLREFNNVVRRHLEENRREFYGFPRKNDNPAINHIKTSWDAVFLLEELTGRHYDSIIRSTIRDLLIPVCRLFQDRIAREQDLTSEQWEYVRQIGNEADRVLMEAGPPAYISEEDIEEDEDSDSQDSPSSPVISEDPRLVQGGEHRNDARNSDHPVSPCTCIERRSSGVCSPRCAQLIQDLELFFPVEDPIDVDDESELENEDPERPRSDWFGEGRWLGNGLGRYSAAR